MCEMVKLIGAAFRGSRPSLRGFRLCADRRDRTAMCYPLSAHWYLQVGVCGLSQLGGGADDAVQPM